MQIGAAALGKHNRPHSTLEIHPIWSLLTVSLISTFRTLLRGFLHPPTSISESLSCHLYARVIPLKQESELVAPLFKTLHWLPP